MSVAVITTPHGAIRCQLFAETAPKTVANFIKLASAGFYDGLAFHRVINNFMIQGGCPHSREGDPGHAGSGGPGYKIPCELGASNPEKHLPGTLSMAHAGRNTGGSQFFVTHVATPHLDGEHTVFGRIESAADLKVVLAVRQGDRFTVHRLLCRAGRLLKAHPQPSFSRDATGPKRNAAPGQSRPQSCGTPANPVSARGDMQRIFQDERAQQSGSGIFRGS